LLLIQLNLMLSKSSFFLYEDFIAFMSWTEWRARRHYVSYYYRSWEFLRRNIGLDSSRTIYPTMIQIGTLNRCNGRCPMCPYPTTVALEGRTEMPAELVSKVIDEVACWNVKKKGAGMMAFTLQNEPLLDSRLPLFLEEARRKLGDRWEIELTTNGVLLCGDMAHGIAKASPHVLNVSVNGFTQETYDRTMPGCSVEKVFENIEGFLAIKTQHTRVIVRYVKQRANDAEYEQLKRYWTARGVSVIGYECNDRLGDVRDYDSLHSQASSKLRRAVRKVVGGRIFSACPFLFAQVNILSDGRVLMCCHDYRHEGILGSLNEGSLVDIYNSQECRDRRDAAMKLRYSGICLRCSLFKTHVWL
jgi:MoaA/NifB/PqqE/SkfB family radical SAM enzyme